MTKPHHIPVLDHLRGIAALAVCVFHFSCGDPAFLPTDDPVKTVGSYGWLGVEAFFVISGFVIPYSLHLRAYRFRDCASFLARRLKRLEPPYLACIAVVILLYHLSAMAPGFRGEPLDLNWQRLLAHLGYLNAVLKYGWLNPVFWTLAIEFQYYLFMALVFPLLAHPIPWVRNFSVISIAFLGGIVGQNNWVHLPHWLPLFSIGMVTFQFYTGRMSGRLFLFILFAVSCISYYCVGSQQTVAGLSTALVIVILGSRELPRVLAPIAFFGTISYSLYLLHTPIGMRVVIFASRLPESVVYRYPAIVIALAVSTFFAYLFWLVVERPSQRWASSAAIRGDSRKRDEQSGEPEPPITPVLRS